MERNAKTKINLVICIVILIIVLCIGSYAYSKISLKENRVEAGEWHIQINDWQKQDASLDNSLDANLNIDISKESEYTRVNPNSEFATGYIGPGSSGDFDIVIDAMDNEVSLSYKIDLTSDSSSLPTGMKFYEDAAYQNEINLLPQSENQEDLKNYAITLKEKLGLSFDADAFQLFLNRCTNVSTLEREITKLSLYGQHLDYESVDQLVSRPLEDNVFDLSNAILKKDKQKTMKLYDDLKKIKTEPIQLIALLAKQFRFLLQVKILKNEKYSNEQIANELNAHPYRVKIALDNCRQFSLKEIKTKLLKLADLDLSIKKGLKDRYIDFEIFLMTD